MDSAELGHLPKYRNSSADKQAIAVPVSTEIGGEDCRTMLEKPAGG